MTSRLSWTRLDLQNIGKQCTFRIKNYHCCWSIELNGMNPDISLRDRLNECKDCMVFQDWLEHFNPSERVCYCDVCNKLRAKGIRLESKQKISIT